MKVLVYNLYEGENENGVVLSEKTMGWNEVNEETAKKEAYNGEYTIIDDGQPDPVAEPTADEVLNAMLGVNRYA